MQVLEVKADRINPEMAKTAINGWAMVFCYNSHDGRGPIITTANCKKALGKDDIMYFQSKCGNNEFRIRERGENE